MIFAVIGKQLSMLGRRIGNKGSLSYRSLMTVCAVPSMDFMQSLLIEPL